MVNVVVTMPVFRLKVPIDHSAVCIRGNVFDVRAPVRLRDIRNILTYTHNLACLDWWVRFSHVLLVPLEVVPEYA